MDLNDNPIIDIKVYDQTEITSATRTLSLNVGHKLISISSSNSCFNNQINVDNSKTIQIRIK